jgi:two-component SAPR family response regulator
MTWRFKLANELAALGLSRNDHGANLADLLRRLGGVGAFGSTMSPGLRIYSIGNFEVYLGQTRIEAHAWKGRKTRYLLAYLAAHSGRSLPDDKIMADFWDERSKSNLYSTCSQLRSLLKRPSSEQSYIVREPGAIRLNQELGVWHDLDVLKGLERQLMASSLDSSQALNLCRQAIALHRGPYLNGCKMEWVHSLRIQVEKIFSRVLTRSLGIAVESGNLIEAEEYAHELMSINPYCEKAAVELIKILVRQGHHEEAHQAYTRFGRKLQSDLGLPASAGIAEKLAPWLQDSGIPENQPGPPKGRDT